MTSDEKAAQMKQRNDAICAYYREGHKLAECASRFKLGRQRVLQILQAAGAWRPYEKNGRDKHLGVTVTGQLHADLKEAAAERGVSTSKLVSDILEGAVK